MQVVVTGGSGLVGQVTVRGLTKAGHNVVIVDRIAPPKGGEGEENFIEVSADNHADLLAACSDAESIVHLAGINNPGNLPPHVVHNNNVTASYNVLSVAAEVGVHRVIIASSVNSIGLTWSRAPEFDYFPIDQHHRTRNEDPYSLSKWLGEQQADSMVRRHSFLSIASLRLHMFMPDRTEALRQSCGELADSARHGLWGYTTHQMWINACRQALVADFNGHEVLFVVADQTVLEDNSEALAATHYPGVELRSPMRGNQGFFDCHNTKAILGWSGRDD